MGVRDLLTDRIEERVTEDRIVDEQILNVIRRSEAGYVGTTEVVDDPHVERGETTVRKRLHKLEDAGRIHKKRIGDPEKGDLTWYLDDDEHERPVNPENYWAAHLVGSAREISGNIIRIGEVVMLTGMLMVLLSLTAGAYGFQIDVLQPSMVGAVGYALAIAGGANIALGGVLKWGFLVTERRIWRNSAPVS